MGDLVLDYESKGGFNGLKDFIQKTIVATGDLRTTCEDMIENDQPLQNTDIVDQYDDWLDNFRK